MPEPSSPRPDYFPSTVTSSRSLGPGTFVISTDGGARMTDARPGHFTMLRPGWGRDPLLPRAFSILRREGDRVDYLVKIYGRGTALLGQLKPGSKIHVLGPLGKPFPDPNLVGPQLLVAGGVGLAPLVWYAEWVRARDPGAELHVVYGARTAADLVLLDDLERARVHLHLATEDGSSPPGGPAARLGRVTVILAELLVAGEVAPGTRVLACGPNPMMRAVAEMGIGAGVETLVSLEGEMACGIGVCLGCPVRVAGPDPGYKYCCVDGPVFDARTVTIP